MMEVTELRNEVIDMGEGEKPRKVQRWKRTLMGQVKLNCPFCSCWFTLGKEFTVDATGLLSDSVYHICDGDSEDDDDDSPEFSLHMAGWVCWPRLIGWND